LVVVRGKEHLTIKATPGLTPASDELAVKASGEPANLGLTVKGMTKELAEQYGIDLVSGVIVTAVDQDSLADARGIKTGDVITEINRQRISTPRQFRDAVKSADPKRGLMVYLVSEGASRFVILKDSGGN